MVQVRILGGQCAALHRGRAAVAKQATVLGLLVLLLTLPRPLDGQGARVLGGGAGAPSSLDTLAPSPDAREMLSDARGAQRRFESLRRQRSPQRNWPWSGTDCDEVVGRICLNHSEGGDWWPQPEDSRIADARNALLSELERAARDLTEEPWILGQRVLYLAEAGRWTEAERLAHACVQKEPARCGSLLGLTLHGQGRFVQAEGAFRSALDAMDEEERARWTDPSVLLDREGEGQLSDALEAGEGRQAALAERVWRLADPLLLVEGNDRLTEHWARRVWASLKVDAANAYAMSWGRDLEEVLVRYGWEVGWDRVLSRSAGMGTFSMVGHHHPESRVYLPEGDLLRTPLDISPSDWRSHVPSPKDGYAPSYAPVILPADGELLRFPRGDRIVVVASFVLPEDTTEHGRHNHPPFQTPAPWRGLDVQAGLFLQHLDSGEVHAVRRSGQSEGALMIDAPADDYLASVEVWSPERGFAGRLRAGVKKPALGSEGLTISDIVLLDEAQPDSIRLEDVVGRLRRPGSVAPRERLALGWEIYASGRQPVMLSYQLSLVRLDRGVIQRLGEWLRISRAEPPLRLAWEESGPASPGPSFRTLALELPDVEPGDYLLRLELVNSAGTTLASERRLLMTGR